jgi:hypothetical protein
MWGDAVEFKGLSDQGRLRLLGMAAVLTLLIAGCAGGGGASTSGSAAAAPASGTALTSSTAVNRTAAACSAWVDSDAVAAEVLLTRDLASATPEQRQATVKQFWSRQEPILASMDQQAPQEIKADIGKLLSVARQGAATGDLATLSSPDLAAADRNLDQYMLRECGYKQIVVTTTDHAYQGLPTTMPAGTVAVTLRNYGHDAHQAVISRAKDGVTQRYTQILALPPDQQLQKATPLALAQADPGQTDTVFLRLAQGRHGAVDFLPEGTTSINSPGGGPPHYTLGMVAEFTVT